MSVDTPESVRALIAGYAGYRGAIDWGPMIDTLTRYAESLERTCEWVCVVGYDCHKAKCIDALSSTLCETVEGYMKFCPYCGARIVEVRE